MEKYHKFFYNFFERFSIGAAIVLPFYCIWLSFFGLFKRLFYFN